METFDLCFQAVAAEFQNESAAALAAAATRHLQEAEQAKNSGNEHWWGETQTLTASLCLVWKICWIWVTVIEDKLLKCTAFIVFDLICADLCF